MTERSVALDPLLYYLHEHSSGSWSHFARAVGNFNADVDEFTVARTLTEHGLVEFLWDGNRSWSVTSAAGVMSNRIGGRISLWGGTHRSVRRLIDAGIRCNVSERWIVRRDVTLSYLHAISIDREQINELREFVPVLNSKALVERLPSLEALLQKMPRREAPSAGASTYRWTYHFGGGSIDEPAPFSAENPSLWRVGRKRYLFVRYGVIREVPEWLGKWLLYAAQREETYAAHYVREGEVLTLPFAPPLPPPPPYVRALLFSGASEIMPTQFGTRCFANVEESLAFEICRKLSVEAEIVERRPREIL